MKDTPFSYPNTVTSNTFQFSNNAIVIGEDLWHVYNLIREGDNVSSVTQRKVTRNARGDSEIVKLKLLVKVENVDFDSEGDEIRLKGRNLTESEHIRLGAYHTLSIIPNRSFFFENGKRNTILKGIQID